MIPVLYPAPAELAWNPATMDVVCDRVPVYAGDEWAPAPTRRRFNLTQELFPGGQVGLAWGDRSPGSYCYALCILDRFLPPPWGGAAYWRGTRLPCSPRAVELVELFHAQCILPMPFWGAALRGAQIRDWIADQPDAEADSGIDLMDPEILREIQARDQD